jgi:hypothetical protein
VYVPEFLFLIISFFAGIVIILSHRKSKDAGFRSQGLC